MKISFGYSNRLKAAQAAHFVVRDNLVTVCYRKKSEYVSAQNSVQKSFFVLFYFGYLLWLKIFLSGGLVCYLSLLTSTGLSGIKKSYCSGGKKKITLSQHYENPFARGILRDLNQQ